MPSETTDIPFKLQNAGNREAGYTVTSNFQTEGWVSFVTDLNHSIVQMPMPLTKGEEVELLLNVSAPSDATPGEIPFSLRAVCPSCGQALFGNDVISKKIAVPVLIDLTMIAEEMEIEAAANGNSRIVYIDLLNLGNDDESYSLELVQSNWKLEAYLSATETPVLDAWDGETSIALNLPMPVGLSPGLYTAKVIATSIPKIDDPTPTVTKQITINIDVTDTAAVWVSDEDADQSYIPGDVAQSMRFEVRNDGNEADRFTMSMDIPDGMNANFEQLVVGNMTPILEPGATYNVTVTFTFDDDTNGQLILKVIATSVNDESISGNGKCTYRVGAQNFLRIISTEAIIIDEPGEYEVVVRIRNQWTEGQSVTASVIQGDTNRWYSADIKSTDRDFWLELEGEREVTVVFEVQSSSLKSLDEDFIETQVTVWAISNSVEDAASLELPVTLKKYSGVDDDEAGSNADGSTDWVGIGIWVVGGALIISLLGALLMVLNGGEEEEEEDWLEDGYENTLSATYGAVAAAPTVGAMEYAKPVPEIDSAPEIAPPIEVVAGPPVPAVGLPEGWTMEQWGHYGQEWLDNQ
jgi:uncharacterized membrane protein